MTAAQPHSSQSLHHVTWAPGDQGEASESADVPPPGPPLDSPAEVLRADVVVEDGAVVVRLCGELDASSVEVLAEALRAASTDGSATVVIDMADLIFIDSMGFNCLMRHHRDHEGTMVLRSPDDHIRRMFVIAGLDKVFPII